MNMIMGQDMVRAPGSTITRTIVGQSFVEPIPGMPSFGQPTQAAQEQGIQFVNSPAPLEASMIGGFGKWLPAIAIGAAIAFVLRRKK